MSAERPVTSGAVETEESTTLMRLMIKIAFVFSKLLLVTKFLIYYNFLIWL